MYKLIIFDFDGTIADTYELSYKVYCKMSDKYKITKLSKQEFDELKSLSIKDIFSKFNIPLYKIPKLVKEALSIYKQYMHQSPAFPQMQRFINILHARNINMAIISSNSKNNIIQFLKKHDMDYFTEIIGKAGILTKHKKIDKFVKQKIKKLSINKDEVLYIGDEVRDINACKKISLKVAAVTWGFDNEQILQKENPDLIIKSDKDLLEILV